MQLRLYPLVWLFRCCQVSTLDRKPPVNARHWNWPATAATLDAQSCQASAKFQLEVAPCTASSSVQLGGGSVEGRKPLFEL